MKLDTNHTSDLSEASLYLSLAESALQNYSLGPVSITFIQHNAGIVFRVLGQEAKQQYLLKIYKRIGIGADPSADQLEPGFHWLAVLAQSGDVVIQTPIVTSNGKFVGQVALTSATQPVSCTLQQWIEGRLPKGDFTRQHAYELGRVMAKLHAFSSTYALENNVSAMHHDIQALRNNVSLLRTRLPLSLLSSRDFDILLAAEQQIVKYMLELGRSSAVWGPVHGDIHYDNVLLYKEEIRPIDFTGLRLAHYLYDIGVTMYHVFHQGNDIRQAFFEGYRQMYSLPVVYEQYVEAFIAYAAIDNIAWNCTIPEQLNSPLFQRNVQNLINNYCASLVQGQRFLFS